MKTLYVSDLDGTLLRSDVKISEYTKQVINEMAARDMLFSYATARSRYSAGRLTAGLDAKIPIIVYNGAAILQNHTYEVLTHNGFKTQDHKEILSALLDAGVYPIVYSYIDGRERMSFLYDKCSQAMKDFLATRVGDERERIVNTEADLFAGDVFYFTCIDDVEKLFPLYERFKEKYRCYYQTDIYSKDQWLEIVPKEVSKANAILQLKEMMGIDHVVAFGDAVNDMEMFQVADEAYAVANAVEELKKIATDVIGSNDEDGVARWLNERLGLGL